jgi:hypothetical protein
MPAMKRSVTVRVGGFARRALAGEAGNGAEHVGSRAVRALRAYLGDKDAGRAGWRVPSFERSTEPAKRVELRLNLDEDLWAAIEAEAATQGVSVDRLVSHAMLYFAAEIDAGWVTQRILEDLDPEG